MWCTPLFDARMSSTDWQLSRLNQHKPPLQLQQARLLQRQQGRVAPVRLLPAHQPQPQPQRQLQGQALAGRQVQVALSHRLQQRHPQPLCQHASG